MMSGKQYFGGLPTGPDVKLLLEHWPQIKEGQEISHEEVERVLKLKRDETRYRGVTMAWRKHLFRNDNIFVDAIAGVGFQCLDPKGRVENGIKVFRKGTREQWRSIDRLKRVQEKDLDPVSQTKRDHVIRLGLAIHAQATDMMRELPKPQAQITQLRKPDDKGKSAA
jgi:hypothetical protein